MSKYKFIGVQLIISLVWASSGKAETIINGDINANTVWTTSGSPYIVTSNISINSSATLRIQPGVTVKIDSAKYIMVNGVLTAIGAPTDSIIITSQASSKRWDKICLKITATCTLEYCRIEYANNSAINNIGTNSVYMRYNNLSNNYAEYYGGAIYNDGTIYIANSNISNNKSRYGGGAIYNDGTITLINSIISYNTTEDSVAVGGGIWNNYAGTIVITNDTISNNTANYKGGAICNHGSATIISNNISYNNTITNWGSGAGVYNEGPASIRNNTISYNIANQAAGGGIYNYVGTVDMTNNIIFNNTAKYNGGGVCNDGTITLTGNIIHDNNSYINGGGIYNYNSGTVTSNTIYNNTAAEDGGAIYNYGDLLTIEANDIYNNTAKKGGGICNYKTATIIDNDIHNNTAEYGGAVYNHDPLVIKYNNIDYNSAILGGSIYDCQGAIIKYNTITDTTVCAIYNSGKPFIRKNNIYVAGYAIYNDTNKIVDAKYNYWDATDTATIKAKIYDYYDTQSKGIVLYKPFLYVQFHLINDTIPPSAPLSVTANDSNPSPWTNKSNIKINWTNPVDSSGISEYYYKLNSVPTSDFDTTASFHYPPDTAVINKKGTIYVWLVDSVGNLSYNNRAYVTINYDIIPPKIDSTTIRKDTSGFWGPFQIKTKVSDTTSPFYNPVLFYNTNIDTDWVADTMKYLSGNKWYKDSIPAQPAQTPPDTLKIRYYITIEDCAGNKSRDPVSKEYIFSIHNKSGAEEVSLYPNKFELFPIAPNPSVSDVVIKYGIPEESIVSLNLYDISGRLVNSIYSGIQEKGYYRFELKNTELTKGVYFIQFYANNFKQRRKLIILSGR